MSNLEGTKILDCPFCGRAPQINPVDPNEDGDAWGEVACINPYCAAMPWVRDNEAIADDRGSTAYKLAAITLWNRRPEQKTKQ